ncbi:hypothetical protein BSL78_14141 [Apostichopus japonicus]|uniref:Ig-like domain-containing protein n=1 Tax=Stichopus japonicus TaxID=307972 RepID=A0A2G8KM16_STIJA|nr:hypothetical protein BSL78_14141 [Apostichopus japonicus]
MVVSAVWICTTLVDGSPQFYVSTDVQYKESDVYFVNEGDDVSLTCEYPMDSLSVGIWKAYSKRNFFSLAVNGQLRTYLNREKYSLTVNSGRNVLTIRGVSMADSAFYGCTVTLFSCGRYGCFMVSIAQTLSLDVVGDDVQNCTLVSNSIFGTYFTGDDIVLSCPTDDISLSIRNGTSGMTNRLLNMVTKKEVGDNIHLIKILSINTTLNGTKLVCMNTENTIDLCENLTVITVYEELMATVTPNSVEVPDGGSTELTCLSNLHDVVSFEFDIQYTNATVGNVFMSEVPGGMKVTITEINFQLDVASSAIVLVTIGVVAAILLYCKSSRKGKPSFMQKNTSRKDEAKAANDQKMPDNDEYYLEPNNGKKILSLDQTDDYYLEPNNSKKVLSLDQTDYEIVGNDAT